MVCAGYWKGFDVISEVQANLQHLQSIDRAQETGSLKSLIRGGMCCWPWELLGMW